MESLTSPKPRGLLAKEIVSCQPMTVPINPTIVGNAIYNYLPEDPGIYYYVPGDPVCVYDRQKERRRVRKRYRRR